jgi:hypothetical protein
MEDDLTTARFVRREPKDSRDSIQNHIDRLAGALRKRTVLQGKTIKWVGKDRKSRMIRELN